MTDIRETANPGPTFDAESMRAILDGRKTQTRQIIKSCMLQHAAPASVTMDGSNYIYQLSNGAMVFGTLPYRVGGVYYARESLVNKSGYVAYKSDNHDVVATDKALPSFVRWPWKCQHTSSFAMPRWAARVWLRITDVRVQRLGKISPADVLAEGVPYGKVDYLVAWILRWEQVNGKGSWERDRNKWVAVYTFETLRPEAAG